MPEHSNLLVRQCTLDAIRVKSQAIGIVFVVVFGNTSYCIIGMIVTDCLNDRFNCRARAPKVTDLEVL